MMSSRIIWAVCLVLSAALYLFAQSTLGLVVAAVVVVVPLVSIVLNQVGARRITSQLVAAHTVEKDEELACTVITKNARPLPLSPLVGNLRCKNLLTGEELTSQVMFPLGAKGTQTLPCNFSSTHCGSLEISVDTLTSFDTFGLWGVRHVSEARALPVVLPKTFAPRISVVPNMTKDIEADEYSQTKAGADPSETFAIRDYRAGDSLRQIHWKLTSKYDHVMVKELGLPVRHSFLVLLETFYPAETTGTSVDSPEVADTLAEIAVSLCQTLVEEEIAFDVAWQDQASQTFLRFRITTMDDLTAILEKMLRASAAAGDLDSLTCYSEAYGDSDVEHLVYLSRFLPATLESFAGEGQLTAIVCAEDVLSAVTQAEENYTVHYCTPQTYEAELATLEI